MTCCRNGIIICYLKQLSSKEEQRRLWLSDGSTDVSSFVEAVEGLFTDTGLGYDLERNKTDWGDEIIQSFLSLDSALKKVNEHRPPDDIIEDPAMDKVRALAAETLALFLATVAHQGGR